MANKFQKSVLERKKIEAELRLKEQENIPHPEYQQEKPEQSITKTATPDENSEKIAEEITINQKIEVPVEEIEEKPVKETKEMLKAEKEVDLSAFLIPQNLRKAKNKTFYLDDEVINAIKSQSAKRKITESKLVNDILKSVLGV